METVGAKEARRRLPEILAHAHREGGVTIVTKHGVPQAAIVPLSFVARNSPRLTALRGSVRGCYCDVARYVSGLRDE